MIDRMLMDTILGKTGTRKDVENKVLELLEIESYFGASDKERRIVRNFCSFMLDNDMKVISIAVKECQK